MKLKKDKKKKKGKEEVPVDIFSRDFPPEEEDDEFNHDGFDSQQGKRGMSPHRRDVEMRAGSRYSNGYSSDQQSDSNDEGPTFLLEHLATFSVGQQHGLVSPKDGLKRLLLMEKSNGIWTQKMQLRLEKKWVVIIDYENGDVVERFPMSLISEPTAYTSNDPRELYNNILVYIVREDPKNKNQTPAEMHIFQCVRVSAQEVVDELKMFISGKWKPGYREGRHILPPPTNGPAETPTNGIPSPSVNVREQVNMFNATAAAVGPPHAVLHRSGSGHGHRPDRATIYPRETSNDETSSTSSDKYERDVAILNHCFDDIERFIARLQHAAAAYKELERRRKSRKTKKKDMGDGMLSMRAKPPPEREFVDILQKFKLSFNLLAKLKSHIHDPNAPELIHFLFTPLALIVDAARDSNYGPNLASKVVTPLLTRDAIDLLLNCCTSKESDLWHSLGDPWSIPRESWKDYQGSYHPVFSDGWAPEYPFTEERERAEVTAAAAATEAQRVYRDKIRRAQEEEKDSRYGGSEYYYSERPVTPERMRPQAYDNNQYDAHPMELGRREVFQDRNRRSPPSEFSTDSIDRMDPHNDPQHQFELQQQQWAEDLKARGAKVVQVMYPRTANNDKELSVIRGEVLEILDDSRKWWKARNIRGQVAHVPHTIVSQCSGPGGAEDDIFNNPLYASRGPSRDHYYSPSDSPSGRDDSSPSGHPSPADHPHRPTTIPAPVPASAEWVRRERQGKKEQFNHQPKPYVNQHNNNNHTHHNNKEEFPAPPPSFLRPISSQNNGSRTEPDAPPPPIPPPPPSPPPKVTSLKPIKPALKSVAKKPPQPSKNEETEPVNSFHEELKDRVTMRPKGKNPWGIRKEHFSGNYLTPESTIEEVQEWLKEKGFSNRASKACQDLTGLMMFALTRNQLEKNLGNDEGPRLHSHLTVQKNICGFKSHKEHELNSILEERRRKVEQKKQEESRALAKKPPSPQEMVASMSLSSEDDEDNYPQSSVASKTLRVLLKEQRRKIMSIQNT